MEYFLWTWTYWSIFIGYFLASSFEKNDILVFEINRIIYNEHNFYQLVWLLIIGSTIKKAKPW